jgi:hypothetical protein
MPGWGNAENRQRSVAGGADGPPPTRTRRAPALRRPPAAQPGPRARSRLGCASLPPSRWVCPHAGSAPMAPPQAGPGQMTGALPPRVRCRLGTRPRPQGLRAEAGQSRWLDMPYDAHPAPESTELHARAWSNTRRLVRHRSPSPRAPRAGPAFGLPRTPGRRRPPHPVAAQMGTSVALPPALLNWPSTLGAGSE